QVGRARPRLRRLDALECIRRFLPHVFPDGFMKVRPFGFLHARGALPPDTLRRMIVQAWPIDGTPTRSVPPHPRAALCPPCGTPMGVGMRLWTSQRAFVDTSGEGRLGQATLGATRLVPGNGTRASASCHQAATDD